MVLKSIQRSFRLLPAQFRFGSAKLLVGIIINSLFDVIGLAAILPVLAVILKEGFIFENPYVFYVYDSLNFSSEKSFIVFLCGFILTFVIFKNLFGIWIQKKQGQFCWNVHGELSSIVLKKAYNRGYSYFVENNSNLILNRVSGIPLVFAQQMLLQIIQFLNEVVILALVLGSILAYDYRILLLLAAIILPFFTIFYQSNKSRVSAYHKKINDIIPQITKPVYELVFGYVDVAIGGVFKNLRETYLNKIREAKGLRIKLLVIQNIPNRLIEICVILAIISLLLYGLFVLKEVDQILTLLSIFGLAAYRTIPSINRVMIATLNIKGQEYSLDLLEELMKSEQKVLEQSEDLDFNTELVLDNLSFSYADADKQVLSDISMSIAKGESVGIVGKSGSGKTTLMNLLLGFLTPTSGQILVDGTPLSSDNRMSWQKKIGYVRQDVFLIDGNLLENVAFGITGEEIDRAKFKEVIELAQLGEFVQQLPEKEMTNIGERGVKISGGQRQRIGIARALYHGAELFLFDEATSSLDQQTEAEITEAMRTLHDNQLTMVIIAHRESTLKYCNRIIKISQGKISNSKVTTGS